MAEWTLFTPSETPDLHDLTGAEFAERYAYYESVAKETEHVAQESTCKRFMAQNAFYVV